MSRLTALQDWFNETLPGRLMTFWNERRAGEQATLLAYRLLFALFPFALSIVAVVGFVLGDDAVRAQVAQSAGNLLPEEIAGEVIRTLDGLANNAGSLGLIGFIGLIWGGGAIYESLETMANRIWDLPPRSMVRRRIVGVLTVPLIGIGLLASGVIYSVSAIITSLSDSMLPGWLVDQDSLVQIVGLISTLLIQTVTFLVIYRITPNRKPGLLDGLFGAVVAAVLLTLLVQVFPIFIGVAGGFGQFGAAFGFTFLVLTYLHLMSQIVVIGMAINAFRATPRSETSRQLLGQEMPPEKTR